MPKIQDFTTSKPKMLNTKWVWAWEVIVREYDEIYEEVNIVIARFFDPWKALEYARIKLKGAWIVESILLKWDNCH